MKSLNSPSVDLDAYARMMLALNDETLSTPITSLTFVLNDVRPVMAEARTLAGEKKKQEALALLQTHLEIHPKSYKLMMALAKTHYGMKNTSLAYQWLENAASVRPDLPDPLLFLLQIDLSKKNRRAAKFHEKAIREIAPNSPYHLHAKALLAINERKFIEADNLLKCAIKLSPNSRSIKKCAQYVDATLTKLKAEGLIPPRKFNRSPDMPSV